MSMQLRVGLEGDTITNSSNSQLQSIDSATLTRFVRRALRSETVEVGSWHAQRVHAGYGYDSAAGSAVHRLSGIGWDQGETVNWSLILKALRPADDRGHPSDWDYWRREADAYQSGLLDDLLGGLSVPRCYGVVDQTNGECWICMEHVEDDIGPQWPLEHYGVVARHLGQFNGAYLTARAIPSYPWLKRSRWLRERVARAGPAVAELDERLAHPLVRRAYPADVVDRLLRVWAQREQLLDALDRLPQTLYHGDAFRHNLFARRLPGFPEKTVAIDWAGVGIGPLGWEIRPLVGSTLTWREVDMSQARELDRIVLAGYLDGLHDLGWRGDPREVRLAQTALFALGLRHLRRIPRLFDEGRCALVERLFGLPITEVADGLAQRNRFTAGLAEEACELLDSLS